MWLLWINVFMAIKIWSQNMGLVIMERQSESLMLRKFQREILLSGVLLSWKNSNWILHKPALHTISIPAIKTSSVWLFVKSMPTQVSRPRTWTHTLTTPGANCIKPISRHFHYHTHDLPKSKTEGSTLICKQRSDITTAMAHTLCQNSLIACQTNFFSITYFLPM